MNRHTLACRMLLLIGLLMLSNLGYTQSEKSVVTKASMTAKVDEQKKRVEVTVNYSLVMQGDTLIPIKGLLFDNNQIEYKALIINSEPRVFALTPQDGLISELIHIERAALGRPMELTIAYHLPFGEIKGGLDLTIPILYIDIPSVDSKEDLFMASMILPVSFQLLEAFPSTGWNKTGEASYDISIPAIPSMLRINATGADSDELAFSYVIDISIAAVLIIFLILGWRKLKTTS